MNLLSYETESVEFGIARRNILLVQYSLYKIIWRKRIKGLTVQLVLMVDWYLLESRSSITSISLTTIITMETREEKKTLKSYLIRIVSFVKWVCSMMSSWVFIWTENTTIVMFVEINTNTCITRTMSSLKNTLIKLITYVLNLFVGLLTM